MLIGEHDNGGASLMELAGFAFGCLQPAVLEEVITRAALIEVNALLPCSLALRPPSPLWACPGSVLDMWGSMGRSVVGSFVGIATLYLYGTAAIHDHGAPLL